MSLAFYFPLTFMSDASNKAPSANSPFETPAELQRRLEGLFAKGEFEQVKAEAQDTLKNNQSSPKLWTLLGGACHALKDHGNALAAFQNALKLSPNDPTAFNNIGKALQSTGDLKKAIQHYQKAASLNSNYFTAFENLADACQKAGALKVACKAFAHAVKLQPNNSGTLFALGSVQNRLGSYTEAIKAITRFIELEPQNANGWNELAMIYRSAGQTKKAIEVFEKAIEVDPTYVGAISNLGNLYKDLDQFDKSVELQRKALSIRDDLALLHNNLGSSLKARGNVEEALEAFNRSYEIEVGNDEQHFVRGLLSLHLHDYENGWPLYDYRRRFKPSTFQKFDVSKEWDGQELEGKSLLIHSEQGWGDTIQFIRFLNHPKLKNAGCSLALKPRLMKLCSSFETEIDLINGEDAECNADNFDCHCYLMSLPLKLGVLEKEIPYPTPYLSPDSDCVAQWKELLGSKGFKIGINWQGNPSSEIDHGRSVPLNSFAPLGEIPDVRLISLQKEYGLEQLGDDELQTQVEDYTDEIDIGDDAFFDTAAIMAQLDLIITTDTATAHLAAALGRPVWILLHHAPDWRWGPEGETSNWYPSARLFRQKTPGDWASVFQNVKTALIEFKAKKESSEREPL